MLIPYAHVERLGNFLGHQLILCFYLHSLSYPTIAQGCVHLLSLFLVFSFSHQIPLAEATSHEGKALDCSSGVSLLVYQLSNLGHIKILPGKMAFLTT